MFILYNIILILVIKITDSKIKKRILPSKISFSISNTVYFVVIAVEEHLSIGSRPQIILYIVAVINDLSMFLLIMIITLKNTLSFDPT